jgi:tetratricopeptide (TPR) repeat protein
VLGKAVRADLAEALTSLSACDAGPELIGLARSSLEPEAEARPRDAGVLAARMAAHRESMEARLRQAELERAEARVKAAEERKRRRLTAALAAAGLGLVVLAAGAGLWFQLDRAERREEAARQEAALRQEVETALVQAVRFRKDLHFAQGRALLEQAKQRLEPAGPDDLRQRVKQALADLQLAESLDKARLRVATLMGPNLDWDECERKYADMFDRSGMGRVGEDVAAVAARVRASAVSTEIVAALDDWVSLTKSDRRAWLLAVAREADPHPWRDRLRQPHLWDDPGALTKLAGEAKEAALSPQMATALGRALQRKGGAPIPLLAAAQARFPRDFWVNFTLAQALINAKRGDEAVGFYRAALAARPPTGPVHYNLGNALFRRGQLDEAVRHYREALRLDPRHRMAHGNLGNALFGQGQFDEAIRHLRQVVRPPDPKLADAHTALGVALQAKGQLDEAIRHHRKAIALSPKFARAHTNLGNALKAKGWGSLAMLEYRRAIALSSREALAHHQLGRYLQDNGRLAEAMVEYRRALAIDPKRNTSHHHLGMCFHDQGYLDEAMVEYRRAIAIDPNLASSHHQLGMALEQMGHLDEAMASYRRAIQLSPKAVPPHLHLSRIFIVRGQPEEAIAKLRTAVQLEPTDAKIHVRLAERLLRQGNFAEGLKAAQRGLELVATEGPGRRALESKRDDARNLLALDRRLPGLLAGKERPAAAELLALARRCRDRGRPYAAARLYASAFAARPALADASNRNRYAAACVACLASFAAPDGPEGTQLGDPERAGLRRQALTWLRADLAQTNRWRESGKWAVSWVLVAWQTEKALAGVRDRAALAKLPAEERKEWERFWADVTAALAADPVEQGRAHAARRRWGAAARCYAQALKRGAPEDGHFWFEYAAVLLLSGDRPGYARACAHMIEKCGKPHLRAYHAARACTLAPGSAPAQAGRLARAELTRAAGAPWSLTEQGPCTAGPASPRRPCPSWSRAGAPTSGPATRCSTGCGWRWPMSASASPRRRGAGWARRRRGSIATAKGCRPGPRRSWACTCTTGWRLTSCAARRGPCSRVRDGEGGARPYSCLLGDGAKKSKPTPKFTVLWMSPRLIRIVPAPGVVRRSHEGSTTDTVKSPVPGRPV